MQTQSPPPFRTVKILVGAYIALSLATLAAVFVMRHDASRVTGAVWVRGSIVAATALLMYTFAARAAQGSARAFLRLRLVTAIMLAAIAVIVAIPGAFPAWMRVEQAACGVLLSGVVVLVNGRRLRSLVADVPTRSAPNGE